MSKTFRSRLSFNFISLPIQAIVIENQLLFKDLNPARYYYWGAFNQQFNIVGNGHIAWCNYRI